MKKEVYKATDPEDRKTDELRVAILRAGVDVLETMLMHHFGKKYNIVIAACPAGERDVSMLCYCENEEAIEGIKGVIVRTIDESVRDAGLMQ